MQHTITHTATLAASSTVLLPAVVALLALSLLDLSEGIRAVLVLALGPFALAGAALGYAASAHPRGLRLAAVVAMAAMVGGCLVQHTGSSHAQPQCPQGTHCVSLADTQCSVDAAEAGVLLDETPLDAMGATCVGSLPTVGACADMGDGGSVLTVGEQSYCTWRVSWVDMQ